MQSPRVCLFCLPPFPPNTPSPALCYLKGYVEKLSPEIHVEVLHWNQTISKMCASRVRPGGLSTIGFNTFFVAVFHGCHQIFRGSVDSSHPLYGAGSTWMIDGSLDSFLQLVEDVSQYIDSEIDAHDLAHCDIWGCSAEFNQLVPATTLLSRSRTVAPQALTILGGLVKPEAVLLLRAFPELDLCVVGDGEEPFHSVCKQYPSREFQSIPGAVFRQSGMVQANDPEPFSGSIVWSDYSGFDYSTLSSGDRLTIPVWDSRGCVWNRCEWCNLNRVSPSFAERSPEDIATEVKHHLESLDPVLAGRAVNLHFLGNTVRGSSRRRLAKLLREMISLQKRYRPGLFVTCELAPHHINEEVAQLLNALSAEVNIGFDHWTDTMLRLMNKSHRMVHAIRALKLVERNPRIRLWSINTLLGFPGETLREVAEALANLYALRFVWRNLARNGQFETDDEYGAWGPSGIWLNPGSPLGRVWDYGNPMMRDLVSNSPLALGLSSMVADPETRWNIAVLDGQYYLPDVTATFQPAKRAFGELFGAVLSMESCCYHSDGVPTLYWKFAGEEVEYSFDSDVYRKVLQLTDKPITRTDLRQAIREHSEEEIQQCISEAQQAGLMYVEKRWIINTLPWQMQQAVSLSLR
jgi:hypothetical protein